MGNTYCSLVTHFADHMQFYSGGYPPGIKIARRQVNLPESKAPKPHFQSVCGEWFEANIQPAKALLRKRPLPLELDRSAGRSRALCTFADNPGLRRPSYFRSEAR